MAMSWFATWPLGTRSDDLASLFFLSFSFHFYRCTLLGDRLTLSISLSRLWDHLNRAHEWHGYISSYQLPFGTCAQLAGIFQSYLGGQEPVSRTLNIDDDAFTDLEWNEKPFFGGEVTNPQRNSDSSPILGLVAVEISSRLHLRTFLVDLPDDRHTFMTPFGSLYLWFSF
ncbi:uncharacterized protein LY79DRAFT_394054 [Colletotrichum navitas]|uniref:Uncharacterized protein n=1 Tax=Colletotrichum navitas TaxID=681940 RepID=A0AAD8PQU4_9PEZI|nr:uncharacterized protein LY79DRAFT_394054 [Colletotrichum navitas]KAK1573998.1 hypothetical protein LY79DRAFT_394054 [Colletotrichum navitas]